MDYLGGQEVEEDHPYQERIRSRWRSQIPGDTKETYRFYAESAPGVRSAQIIRTPRGAGTPDVIIVSVRGIPSTELIHAVEAALHDRGDEYRDRVASASFFLTRAGERSYVMSQLEAHFGVRYLLTEQFLQLYIKILDLSDEDRVWVLECLDSTLDPNILLTVAEWFHFIDTVPMDETLGILATPRRIRKYGFRKMVLIMTDVFSVIRAEKRGVMGRGCATGLDLCVGFREIFGRIRQVSLYNIKS